MKLWWKIWHIFLLFSLFFSSFNHKYLKFTKMDILFFEFKLFICCQLRARRALSQFNDVPLRTRRVLSLYKCYGYLAPFWFSRKHHWAALMPFWFSADKVGSHICLQYGTTYIVVHMNSWPLHTHARSNLRT